MMICMECGRLYKKSSNFKGFVVSSTYHLFRIIMPLLNILIDDGGYIRVEVLFSGGLCSCAIVP